MGNTAPFLLRRSLRPLSFGDAATRLQAANSLGARGQAEAVPHLLERLSGPEHDPAVRGEIYRALGQLGDMRTFPRLKACLKDEARAELRGVCVAALGGIGSQAALDAVLETLEGDSASLVRARSIDALGRFTYGRAIDALAAVAGESDTEYCGPRRRGLGA